MLKTGTQSHHSSNIITMCGKLVVNKCIKTLFRRKIINICCKLVQILRSHNVQGSAPYLAQASVHPVAVIITCTDDFPNHTSIFNVYAGICSQSRYQGLTIRTKFVNDKIRTFWKAANTLIKGSYRSC